MPLVPLLRNATLALLLAAASAHATIYEIQTTSDDASLNGNCTLREAIRAAVGNAPVDQCPAGGATDLIGLPAGIYAFTLGDELLSGSGVDLTIIGATGDRDDVTINLALASRFLRMEAGASLVLEDLTVALGKPDDEGGVILAEDSNLHLINFEAGLNQALRLGGVVEFNSFATPTPVELVIRGSLFSGNVVTESGVTTPANGGAVRAYIDEGSTAEIVDSEFIENRSVGGDTFGPLAGGLSLTVADDSAALVARNLFEGNRIEADVDGPNAGTGGGALISAFSNGTIDVEDNRFVENVADSGVTASAGGIGFRLSSFETGRIHADRNTVLDGIREGSASSNSIQVSLGASDSSELVLSSSLVAEVGSGSMRGIFLVSSDTATLRLVNLTVTGHSGSGIEGSDAVLATTTIANTISVSNLPNLNVSGVVIPTNSKIGGASEFVDAANGDFRLEPGAGSIDGGNASAPGVGPYDAAHATRVIGSDVDQGAFEFTGIFADGFDLGDDSSWDVVVGALE